MNRFLLFAGDQYYPEGGARDLIEQFDSVEEAKSFLVEEELDDSDWWHIWDCEKRKAVGCGGNYLDERLRESFGLNDGALTTEEQS